MDQIEEVLAKTDIVELINERVPLKKAGQNYKALCPFHSEKTPSFTVSSQRQIFKCFGCHIGGDAYKFLMEYEKMDFGEALRYLADRAGVKLKSYRPRADEDERKKLYQLNHLAAELYHYLLTEHKVGQKALNYLLKRGIKRKTIKEFNLGYAPQKYGFLEQFLVKKKGFSPQELVASGLVFKNRRGSLTDRFRGRVMFVLKDRRDNIVGFSGRIIEPQENTGKYINTPETMLYHKSQLLFGFNKAKDAMRQVKKVFIVEGEFDMISLFQAGVENVVAIKGSALTIEQIKLLKRYVDELLLALDEDSAGDAATRRGIQLAINEGLNVKVVRLGDYKDPDEAARDNIDFFKKQAKAASGIFDFYISSALERFNINEAWGKKKVVDELAPLLKSIDNQVLRSHYILRLAQELTVDEEAILQQVEQSYSSSQEKPYYNNRFQKKETDRYQRLQQYLFSVCLQYHHEKELLEEKLAAVIVDSGLSRLLKQLKDYLKKNKKFNSNDFLKQLPKELQEIFNNLYLTPLPAALEDEEKQEKEIAQTKKEIAVFFLRQKIALLTKKITRFENEGKTKKVADLETEMTPLIRKLRSVLK